MRAVFDDKLTKAIHCVAGQFCRDARLSGDGTDLLLQLGRTVCAVPPQVNADTSQVLTCGEYSFDFYCSWRIETVNEVLCTWQDCRKSKPGRKQAYAVVKSLEQAMVVDSTVCFPSGDLTLRFSNNLIVRVFCDMQVGSDDEWPNYDFSIIDTLFTLEREGVVTIKAINQQYYNGV